MARSLYICYFGVDEPLVHTQVVPYLRELVKGGHEIALLTFEPGEVDEAATRERLAEQGIEWFWLRYHKRPSVPATMFDIANGARLIRKLAAKDHFDILHARSHVPMAMAAIARKFSSRGAKILFDIRGFMPEEYVDAGIWADGGIVYRLVKRAEGWLMKMADGFVVLTEKARDLVFPGSRSNGNDKIGRPVEVIPCCVDFEKRFSGDPAIRRQRIRKELGIGDRKVFVHLGALGGLYLSEQIADLVSMARSLDGRTFALFLTQSDPSPMAALLEARGFGPSDMFLAKVPAADVENYLYASDVGISIVKASYATQSRSPTKIPEYLACGLPIIANRGVGDVDDLIERNGVGVLLGEFDAEGYSKALEGVAALGDIADRCRETARREFDLTTVGGERYRRIYARVDTTD